MTDETQTGPPARADVPSEPGGDVPAVVGPDAPTEVAAPEPAPVVTPPPAPGVATPPSAAPTPEWRPEDDISSAGPAALAAERPEVAIGAAFGGGLVLALLLKRLAR